MHFYQLYGIFGRKQEVLRTVNILRSELPQYTICNIIKSVIDINEKIVAIQLMENISSDTVKN